MESFAYKDKLIMEAVVKNIDDFASEKISFDKYKKNHEEIVSHLSDNEKHEMNKEAARLTKRLMISAIEKLYPDID